MPRRGPNSDYIHPKNKPHYARLTPKEQRFSDHYVETLKQTESAMVAYDIHNPISAKKIGNDVSNRPDVREAILQEFERRGITTDRTSSILEDAMNATKKEKDYIDGTVEEVIDHSVRLNAVKEVNKIMDVYPANRTQIDKRELKLTILSSQSENELLRALQSLELRLKNLKTSTKGENESNSPPLVPTPLLPETTPE